MELFLDHWRRLEALNLTQWIEKLLAAAVIIGAGLLLAAMVTRLLRNMRKSRHSGVSSIYIVEKLVGYGIIVLSGFIALSAMGIQLTSLAVFAGAIGVGVGLGLQGVVKDFVSGLFIIFDPTMRIGDFVETADGIHGEIMEVGPRATRIRTNDSVNIVLPNSHLIENQLINWTYRGDTRRVHIPFSVAYGSDKAQVREVVLQAARNVSFTLADTETRKTQVWLTGFGDSALNFELVVWPSVEAVRRPGALKAAYNWAIEDALREAGLEIPFPQMDVRLRRSGEETGALELIRRKAETVADKPDVQVGMSQNDAEADIEKRSAKEN